MKIKNLYFSPVKSLSFNNVDTLEIIKNIGIKNDRIFAFSNNLNFKDIEVINDKLGKPYYTKNKKISKIVQKKFNVKNFNCFLSISDEKDYSTAFAIIQTK